MCFKAKLKMQKKIIIIVQLLYKEQFNFYTKKKKNSRYSGKNRKLHIMYSTSCFYVWGLLYSQIHIQQ